jgi:hypothetical protein
LYLDVTRKTFSNLRYDKEIEESSLALRYIDHNAKLEAGVDFSAMCSIVTAQPRGNYLYGLKEFHTLAPANKIQLGKKFRDFYKYPKDKALDRYYDRSGIRIVKPNEIGLMP